MRGRENEGHKDGGRDDVGRKVGEAREYKSYTSRALAYKRSQRARAHTHTHTHMHIQRKSDAHTPKSTRTHECTHTHAR